MSLSSAMSKIVGFTNDLVGLTSASSTHANIPSSSFTRIMGIEGDLSFGSLSDIKNSIGEIKEGIAQTASIVYCAYTLATSKQGLAFLDQLVTGVAGVIGAITDQIIDAIAVQISNAAQQVIGCVTSVIDALQNLVASVLILAEAIVDMAQSWTHWADLKIELEIEEENCKDMFSSIAACLLNKYLGPYIEEFTDKIVGKINEVGNNFNNALYEGLQDANTFASYANQEAFLLKKASIQMKGLTKENLLGTNE